MSKTHPDPTPFRLTTSIFPTAVRLLAILTMSVFLAEMRNYFHSPYFSALPEHTDILFHVLVTTTMVFPFLYFFAYRPLLKQISERERTEVELKKARDDMEKQVEDRTAELLASNQALYVEIEERRRVQELLEKSYRNLEQLTQAERHQRQLAESLVQATLAFANSLNPDEVFDRILEQVHKVVPCRASGILLLDGKKIHMVRYRGVAGRIPGLERLETGIQLDQMPQLRRAILEEHPRLLGPGDLNPDWVFLPGLEWIKSAIIAPLAAKEEPLGFLVLVSEAEDYFKQTQVELIQAFAAHAVLAIQNARIYDELRNSREHLQGLTRRLVEVQEAERRTISRELHDEAGQALTSIKLGLNLIGREVNNPGAVLERLNEMEKLTDQVMENLHNLAIDLRPASLEYLGLVTALQQYLSSVKKNNNVEVQFESLGIEKRLPIEIEITLYRIVQEAVTNILRHASATLIDVLVEKRDKKIAAIIEDNGVGFNPAIYRKTGHLGLFGMRERAEMFGGRLVIESKPGSGTTIFAEIPYDD